MPAGKAHDRGSHKTRAAPGYRTGDAASLHHEFANVTTTAEDLAGRARPIA